MNRSATITPALANNAAAAAPRASADVAWGLELTTAAAELVRLERRGDVVRVDRRQTFDGAGVPRQSPPDPALVLALAQVPANEPLAICFPDELMLCRGLSLPRAAPAALEKMVQAQAEALLSVSDDRLSWTWQAVQDPSNPGMQWVLICAARRDLIEQIKRLAPAGVEIRSLVPRVVASVYAARAGANASNSSRLLVDVTNGTATVALLSGDQLLRSVVVDRDEDDDAPPHHHGNPNGWARELRESYRSLIDGIPGPQRPQLLDVRAPGANGDAATLAPALAATLGLNLNRAGAETADDADSAAVAVARLVLDHADAQQVNFARAPKAPIDAPAPVKPRRLATILAACAIGVLVLYGLDVARASWLNRQLDHLRTAEVASAGIERRLAVDRFVERNTSPALPGLDTILTAAPQSLTMSTFSLSPAGQFRLVGALGSSGELDEFLRKLQASRALTNVQLRSGRVENNRWSIELTADATPMAGLLLASSKPAAPAPNAPVGKRAGASGAPTAVPTTAPTTAPTTVPTTGSAKPRAAGGVK